MPIIEAPTITSLPAEARGAVVVSGSHGGRYPGYLAAKAKVRAVVLSDAGVGRDGTGIASLAYLERYGIAAESVVAIGDADNDLPMLAVAGLAVAMENSMPRVLALAGRVIGSNNSDTLADLVEELF